MKNGLFGKPPYLANWLDTVANRFHRFGMYYLWFNETQSGPFTLQQVQSMWQAGQITAETLYWQEGQTDWLPLGNIISIIEAKPETVDETMVIPHLAGFARTGSLRGNVPAAQQPVHEPAPEPVQPERNLWTGHPTLWKWTWFLLAGVVVALLPVGILMFFDVPLLAALSPLPVALIIFLYVYLVRNSIRYAVTNKRVSLETGIFTKTSRELRIQDIRAIAAEVNFIGYGDIEFSSASNEDGNVTFLAVPKAASVRDLVKKLQA